MPKHNQRTITNPIGQEVEVDEGLADFLLHLWAENYVTIYSCQSNFHGPYIMFPYRDDALRFMENYGGHLSPITYVQDRAVVDGFVIPTKEQLSLSN